MKKMKSALQQSCQWDRGTANSPDQQAILMVHRPRSITPIPLIEVRR